jgi:hypothetical protein
MKKILVLGFILLSAIGFGQLSTVPMGVGTKLNVAFPIINTAIDSVNAHTISITNIKNSSISLTGNNIPPLPSGATADTTLVLYNGAIYYTYSDSTSEIPAVNHNYYVSNAGNDGNDGLTPSSTWEHHPWMSSWTGGVVLEPGDNVYMKRGDTWTETGGPYLTVTESGTIGNYITTTAYGTGAQPLIELTDPSYAAVGVIDADGKSYIKFNDIEINNYSSTYGSEMGINLKGVTIPCHDWIIINCTIHDIPHTGIYAPDNAYEIVIGDVNATATATTTEFSNHIYDFGYAGVGLMGSNPIDDISNFKVYYNYIHNSTRTTAGNNAYGIHFEASSSSNTWPNYAYCSFNNVQNIGTWEPIDVHGGTYIFIKDNYIKNFGFVGIMIGMGTRLTAVMNHIYVERNTIEQPTSGWVTGRESTFIIYWNTRDPSVSSEIYIRDNNLFYTTRPGAAAFTAITLNGANGVTISGNNIYNGSSVAGIGAIYFQSSTAYGNRNVTIKNNFIKEWGAGISFYGSSVTGNVTIASNIIDQTESGACIRFYDAASATSDMYLYNNVFLNDTYGYVFYNTFGIAAGGKLTAKNNVFARLASGALTYWYLGTISGTFTCDYNIYWNTSTASPFYTAASAQTLDQWVALGYDTNSPNGTDESLDPTFTNAGGSYLLDTDFSLTVGSPAINAGTDVGIITDYFDNDRVGDYDIGAIEKQ